jgi:hypothetical protein
MQFDQLKRREFITLVGGAAAWPLAARAQQPERMRRIGVLMTTAADDPEGQARVAAFLQGLQQWGWTVGGNVRIDIRFGADNAATRKHASDLASLAPDVILANSSAAVGSLLRPAPCLSYSQSLRIRSALGSSTAWRALVATQPALPRSSTV